MLWTVAVRLLLPLAFVVGCCHSRPLPASPPRDARLRSHVGIVTRDGGRYAVEVELALTPKERATGLMNRRTLGADQGMLFVFRHQRNLSFWMHNTLIPLDMVFIDSAGTIVGIVENAAPLTETPRQVDRPSRYVLEVNGGWSAEHGVAVGDHVLLADALRAARERP